MQQSQPIGLMEPTEVELVETSLRLYGMLKRKNCMD
jgi:hypothetical protein